ncbi:MAG: hypothetical protein DSY91_01725 [Deltaproteobacteria bacterium]|nr:MAG: hypothetical protein DSY91_01725 [Deltaproteobacteria bacterium]
MNPMRKLSDLARNPYIWAATCGLLASLIASVYFTGQLRTEMARGILAHYEQKIVRQTFTEHKPKKIAEIDKLASLRLWGKETRGGLTASAPSGPGQSLSLPAGTQLVLKGIVRYPDGHFEAVFSDRQGKRAFVVTKGDKLSSLEVLEIRPDRVVVSQGGKEAAYFLFTKKRGKSGKIRSTSSSLAKEGNSGTHVILNKNEVQSALSDMASFLRQVRIVPYMEKGKPKGFQLLEIVPGSIVDRVGLKNGDVVEQVNGKPIHTPQEAMKLFSLLQAGKGLTLEYKRNNQRKSISIELK